MIMLDMKITLIVVALLVLTKKGEEAPSTANTATLATEAVEAKVPTTDVSAVTSVTTDVGAGSSWTDPGSLLVSLSSIVSLQPSQASDQPVELISFVPFLDKMEGSDVDLYGEALMTSTGNGTYLDEEPVSVSWEWFPVRLTWWLSVNLISSILGIIGNLLVILVIWMRGPTRRSMDTLIGALAVADFLTSIFISPKPVARVIPRSTLGELYCRLVQTSYFMWVTVGASVYTLALISVERLIAVVFPIYFNRLSSRKRIVGAILTVWTTSLVFFSSLIIITTVDAETHVCVTDYGSAEAHYSHGVIVFVVIFFIPTVVMLVSQILTAVTLHRKSRLFRSSSNRGKAGGDPSYNLLLAKQRVIQLLFMIVSIFIICWGPASVGYLLYNVGAISPSYLYGPIYSLLFLLAFWNSCLNPLIYTIRQPKFRNAIRELFICKKPQDNDIF